MIYRFKANIILRVLFLTIIVVGLVVSYMQSFYLTTFFFSVLLLISVGNLIYYVNQTNRDIANFFSSVKYNDFTTTTSAHHRGETFGELYNGFNLINQKFKDIRAENEANHQFLKTIVEHVDIGLLCMNHQDEVILMNKALQNLLRKPYLVKLEGLKKINEQLWEKVSDLESGKKDLIKLNINNQLLQVAIQAIKISLNGNWYKLVSFQNIKTELEEQEFIAWQKLIRILTHEIMNSVAPIASLSSTMKDVLAKEKILSIKHVEQVKKAMAVIQKRSEGLLEFTETYRSLTRIPPPKFQVIEANELINNLSTLFQLEFEQKGIDWNTFLPPSKITFQGDPVLLEQVLINLVKNAIEAVEGKPSPKIEVFVQKESANQVSIKIADNGSGISEDKMEQIFVPFFTTKENGSGIGLSLSRQIMHLHNGNIEMTSKIDEGTIAALTI